MNQKHQIIENVLNAHQETLEQMSKHEVSVSDSGMLIIKENGQILTEKPFPEDIIIKEQAMSTTEEPRIHPIIFNEAMGDILNVANIVKKVTAREGWPSNDFLVTSTEVAEIQENLYPARQPE